MNYSLPPTFLFGLDSEKCNFLRFNKHKVMTYYPAKLYTLNHFGANNTAQFAPMF